MCIAVHIDWNYYNKIGKNYQYKMLIWYTLILIIQKVFTDKEIQQVAVSLFLSIKRERRKVMKLNYIQTVADTKFVYLSLETIIKDILHNSLRGIPNAHYAPGTFKTGMIATFKSKTNMQKARGTIYTHYSKLINTINQYTHWTPNPYYNLEYTTNAKIYGHKETRLQLINTFVVDIDFPQFEKKLSVQEIELAIMDTTGFVPTIIIDTPKGYHCYFVLDKPIYISNNNNYKSLRVAKAISQTLRTAIAKKLPCDQECNDFGIFRIPTSDTVVSYCSQAKYTFTEFMNWSIQQGKTFTKYKEYTKKAHIVNSFQQIKQKWYKALYQTTHIIGGANCGRNNTIFTMALANKQSGISEAEAIHSLVSWNRKLTHPLTKKEVIKTVKSAYKSRFVAARSDFIDRILTIWGINKKETLPTKAIIFRKHKKKRADRRYSHSTEWEKDLITYLDKQNTSQSYFFSSKKELTEKLGIPERTLDRLLKRLKQENKIIFTTKAGRNGGLIIATVKKLLQTIIRTKKQTKTKIQICKKQITQQTIHINRKKERNYLLTKQGRYPILGPPT